MQNFAFPYFSRDIAEFWRRWHISLSTWFRDYLYIPLGGSRGGLNMKIRNTFIIFIVSGFWHGANWTFVVWGALNAIYFLPLLLTKNNRNNIEFNHTRSGLPTLKDFVSMTITFVLTLFAWIVFRAENMTHFVEYIGGMFNASLFSLPLFDERREAFKLLLLILGFVVLEWKGRSQQYGLQNFGLKWNTIIRRLFYSGLALWILWSQMSHTSNQFIYFQF
jgi:D-alanyl-lipoteichoic acid acyltransferase DltB (MBOAT superfamily)